MKFIIIIALIVATYLNLGVNSNVVVTEFNGENNNLLENAEDNVDNKLEIYKKITPSGETNLNNNIIERVIDDGNGNNNTIPDQTKLQQTIRYTLGHRSGVDRLVAKSANNYHYNSLMNIVLRLCYPNSGVGAIITYVEVVIDQLSNKGRAYITSGGIGQRNICVSVEANMTNFISYRASFYGY